MVAFPRVLPWAKLFYAFGVRTEYSHRLWSDRVREALEVRLLQPFTIAI
jgi:hypothetical protein